MAQVNRELGVKLNLLMFTLHDAAGRLEAAYLRATERVMRSGILANTGVTRRRSLLLEAWHDLAASHTSLEVPVRIQVRWVEAILLLDAERSLQLVRGRAGSLLVADDVTHRPVLLCQDLYVRHWIGVGRRCSGEAAIRSLCLLHGIMLILRSFGRHNISAILFIELVLECQHLLLLIWHCFCRLVVHISTVGMHVRFILLLTRQSCRMLVKKAEMLGSFIIIFGTAQL